jgi:Na+/H+-dicarboxylate symporter
MVIVTGNSCTDLHRAFTPALALGCETASSAATMPVTMQNAEDFGAVSSIVRFVVPLGTNFNR